MLVILVSFAFGFGLALARVGLPPMVGFNDKQSKSLDLGYKVPLGVTLLGFCLYRSARFAPDATAAHPAHALPQYP